MATPYCLQTETLFLYTKKTALKPWIFALEYTTLSMVFAQLTRHYAKPFKVEVHVFFLGKGFWESVTQYKVFMSSWRAYDVTGAQFKVFKLLTRTGHASIALSCNLTSNFKLLHNFDTSVGATKARGKLQMSKYLATTNSPSAHCKFQSIFYTSLQTLLYLFSI